MPLYKRETFKPKPHPPNLRLEDEVFYCPLTKEIFTDYEEFFERSILLNSLVWSCAYTGKTNLTFEEALESEKLAKKKIDAIPPLLEQAVLAVAALTKRANIHEAASDVWTWIKDRYPVGDIVEAEYDSVKQNCKVLQSEYIPAEVNGNISASEHANDNEELENGDSNATGAGTPAAAGSSGADQKSDSGEKKQIDEKHKRGSVKKITDPSSYKYLLRPVAENDKKGTLIGDAAWVTCDSISGRKKALLTRNACRNLVKHKMECVDDYWKIKPEVAAVSDIEFEHYFSGPPPSFFETPIVRRPHGSSTGANKSKHKQDKSKRPSTTGKENAEAKDKTPQLTKEEIQEIRTKLKEARLKEKEKIREEKRQQREALAEWRKIRDDLLCDDLQPLPDDFEPVVFPEFLTEDEFGRCLMILQYIKSFSESLTLSEFFPRDFSLDTLYQCLISCDPAEGPTVALFGMLLSAVRYFIENEDGTEVDLANKDECEDVVDLSNRTFYSAIASATYTAEKCREIHGSHSLPLDGCTITESLRQHVLSSGYFPGKSVVRWRFEQRGCFRCYEDPAFNFRSEKPKLIDSLSKCSIFELDASARLDLIELLVNQLLTFSHFRQDLENSLEQVRLLRSQLRTIQAAEARQQRDATMAKGKLLLEEKSKEELKRLSSLTESNQNVKSEESPTEGADRSEGQKIDQKAKDLKAEESPATPTAPPPPISKEEQQRIDRERQRVRHLIQKETNRMRNPQDTRGEIPLEGPLSLVSFDLLSNEEIDLVRSLQKEHFFIVEQSLFEKISHYLERSGCLLLGRDRAYRQYWLMSGISALLIETPGEEDLGECDGCTPLDKVTLNSTNTEEIDTALNLLRGAAGGTDCLAALSKISQINDIPGTVKALLACSGDENCPVHYPERRARWQFISNSDVLARLIASLNKRGIRESELAEQLRTAQVLLKKCVNYCPLELLRKAKFQRPSTKSTVAAILENSLREAIFELEEKIFNGKLGSLQVQNREKWRESLRTGCFDSFAEKIMCCKQVKFTRAEVRMAERPVQLAVALLQVAQGVNLKNFKKQFVPDPNGKSYEEEIELGSRFELWQQSLLESKGLSQISLHIWSLENQIQWAKSMLQLKCRSCGKKGDQTSLVRCASCEYVYHLRCTRPMLKKVTDNWICVDCSKLAMKAAKIERQSSMKSTDTSEIDDEEGSSSSEEEEPVCVKCGLAVKDSRRADCIECLASYHKKCAKLKSVPKNWLCTECDMPDQIERPSKKQPKASGSDSGASQENKATPKSQKRQKSDRPTPTSGKTTIATEAAKLAKCNELLDDLMKQDSAEPFLRPVSKKIAPDYYDVIGHPMDLRTIYNRLSSHYYRNFQEFEADAKLIFQNCRVYNAPEAPVYQAGKRLEAYMIKRASKLGLDMSASTVSLSNGYDHPPAKRKRVFTDDD